MSGLAGRIAARLGEAFAEWARRRRETAAATLAEWEAETEPGYPMPGLMDTGVRLTLAVADIQDTFAAALGVEVGE